MKKWKKMMAGLLALALVLLGLPTYSMEVQAASSGDFTYMVNSDGSSVAIIGYSGNGGEVTIPSEIDGKSVTEIGPYAFSNCYSLVSVSIPDSVTSIGTMAFSICTSLTEINIPDNVTSIGDYVFRDCISLTEINIPDSVTGIGQGVFLDCSSLAAISVAKGNTTYDSRENCNAIIETEQNMLLLGCKNTNIPDSVTGIGNNAFFGSNDLTEISIPNSVTSIGESAFYFCSSLKEINISSGVARIEKYAFYGCSSLKEISIPDSVTSIGQTAFDDCSSLAAITVAEGNTTYDSRENCNAIIETASNTLLSGCKNTKIPDSVTSIGDYAFQKSGLKEISIPDSVTSIGSRAFLGCKSLNRITISSNVAVIKFGAFQDCFNLTEVSIPGSVTSIENDAFSDCKNLASVTISSGVGSVGTGAFSGCSSLKEISIPGSVTSIGSDAFSGCKSLARVSISSGVESIGDSAFRECSSLKEIGIPGSVKDIGRYALGYVMGLGDMETVPGFVIHGESGSEAETYANENKITFEAVSGNDIRWADVALSQTCYTYDGTEKRPSVTVKLAEKELSADTDYTVSYSDNTNVGSAKATVSGIGNYMGIVERTYTIDKADISAAVVTLETENYTYDGQEKRPSVTVSLSGRTLVPNTDYTVIYRDNTNVGTAVVIVIGKGGCTGNVMADFTISASGSTEDPVKTDIANATVTLDKTSYTYDGTAKTPSITVTLSGKELVLNTDYTVTYINNMNVGTATVTVTGISNYTGSVTADFMIIESGSIEDPVKTDIAKATVTLDKTSYTYDGTAKTPSVTVELDGKTLAINTDYTVSYSNNTNEGTATVTVTGKGGYTGSTTADFMIVKATENPGESPDVTPDRTPDRTPDTSITCKKTVYNVTYGAKPFKINATSKGTLAFISSSPKIAAVDRNTGTVTIKGTGIAIITIKSGTNTVNVTVRVSPKKASLKTVKAVKGKKLTVKWAKDKNASGYQVQVSTDKNFKKNKKQKNVTKTSCTFTKLKAGKRYYVRVRSYKKSGKEKLYGAWSSKKQSSKVKK